MIQVYWDLESEGCVWKIIYCICNAGLILNIRKGGIQIDRLGGKWGELATTILCKENTKML